MACLKARQTHGAMDVWRRFDAAAHKGSEWSSGVDLRKTFAGVMTALCTGPNIVLEVLLSQIGN
ncbi:hypothetical protein ASY01nite_18420 [Acetobacter syzygii]|nr:hypothetical protein Absy_010_063 [Acetobacter syzygii]GEL56776.1 hypothetical protein ASY01nite_18420 [Acetobacter syzygii]